jgi:hypothetical protein
MYWGMLKGAVMGDFPQSNEASAKLQAALTATGDHFEEGWNAGKRYAFDIGRQDIDRLLTRIRGIGVDLLHANLTDGLQAEKIQRMADSLMKLHDELLEKWRDIHEN